MEKKYFPYLMLLLLALTGTFTSCSLFSPPAIIPCYGHIDSIPLIITNPNQGTAANGINCTWVYVDDNPVGAFQLPCTFPMIATTGPHKVTIFAGVESSGEAENRLKYPFYTAYTLNSTTLTQGATVKFKPTVEYASWAKPYIIEDFNGFQISGIVKDPSDSSHDTNMVIVSSPKADVYQGSGSGYVAVNAAHPACQYITKDTFNIPGNGQATFLEINYKTNILFTVGVHNEASNYYYPVVYIDTSSTWKKMYINLQPTMASYPSPPYGSYKIYFNIAWDNSVTTGQTYLDNIKLIRY